MKNKWWKIKYYLILIKKIIFETLKNNPLAVAQKSHAHFYTVYKLVKFTILQLPALHMTEH